MWLKAIVSVLIIAVGVPLFVTKCPSLKALPAARRLVEDADLRAAQELFGGGGDLQQQKLKTLKEHEIYGRVCTFASCLALCGWL